MECFLTARTTSPTRCGRAMRSLQEAGLYHPRRGRVRRGIPPYGVYREGRPAASGRIYCDADGPTFHIVRISGLKAYRGEHLGQLLMERL